MASHLRQPCCCRRVLPLGNGRPVSVVAVRDPAGDRLKPRDGSPRKSQRAATRALQRCSVLRAAVRQPVVAPAQEESVSASVATVETDGERLLTGERLLSRAEVCDRVGRTFPIIWNMMREGRFPRARSTSPSGGPLWLESELVAWMRALPVKSYKGDAEAAPAAEPEPEASAESRRRAKAEARRKNVRARAGKP